MCFSSDYIPVPGSILYFRFTGFQRDTVAFFSSRVDILFRFYVENMESQEQLHMIGPHTSA